MTMNPYLHQYQNNQIATAKPEQILILLYDGAIRFVYRTATAIAEKNVEQKNLNINKTVAILSELSATLDHNIGGQIAADLAALYDFMIRELTAVNLTNNQNRLENVRTILSELRDTWAQAVKMTHGTKTSKSPAAGQSAGAAQL
jgi:flagellar protein FliS